MTHPTPLHLVALSEHDWLRESAVRALAARSVTPEQANARLAAWLAIALRAGASRADLVSRGAALADLLDCYCPDAEITPAQRAIAADALCHDCSADWRSELARHTAWVLHNAGTHAALARAGDLLRLSRWFHNTQPLTRPIAQAVKQASTSPASNPAGGMEPEGRTSVPPAPSAAGGRIKDKAA